MTVGGGLLFPHAVESIGSDAANLTAECLWQPDWPYQDSLANRSARELATSYENPAFYAEGRNIRLGLEVTF